MKFSIQQSALAVLTAILIIISLPDGVSAKIYDLRADTTSITMPDGTVVPVWGFADITSGSGDGIVKVPGPTLDLPAADANLTINLTNKLPVPVSIYIPGLMLAPAPAVQNGRVMSFTAHALAAPAGGQTTASFTFTGLKPGTLIYQSGTNPSTQIPMGLYGAVIVRPASAGQAYNNAASAYDNEQVVVFSEIDPAFNAFVSSKGTTIDTANKINYSLSYAPKYFLINGKTYPDTASPAAQLIAPPAKKTLLRLVNAGSQNHVPTIAGKPVKIISEDGNYRTYPRFEHAPILAAGKTLDAILDLSSVLPTEGNFFTMFDRRAWRASSTDTTGTMLAFIKSYPTAPDVSVTLDCSPFKGDMNADSKIDLSDVIILLNKFVSSAPDLNGDVTPLSEAGLPCGSGTGVLKLSDALYLLRKALNIN